MKSTGEMSKKKMNSRSLESVAQDLESAMMTSAYLLEEAMSSDDDISSDVITISSCEEKRKSWISDDEVSSDVSNQHRATVQPAVDSADALCDGNNQLEATVHPDESYTFDLTSRWVIQSQDDASSRKMMHPVASYSAFSRRKSRRRKSRRSEELQPGAK
ncbi:DNA polymerase I B, chloroplastic/mitochondrial-like [Dorcoceras hygrometricum]|uniref:DNA polymerase I B, chloroplastic/mitochondrial-like n=1 Tax=Dorcoceras hygrometricum TaxID=472368 RepID=A0A2Z7BCZ4_9LAMI|nr:DNA polymerase I B, chloroplastic/mitochondrial-like [Dorcoceras hygrometricum]